MGALRTSCMIALILAGADFLSLAMGFTGLPRNLAAWIAGLELTPLALIAALTVFYIVLGCFLDGISAVVLTMVVVEPMVRQAGIDMLWFGIRSEEHTSELQSLMRISYAVFCLKKKKLNSHT